ncbi:MAG: hypothetical protein IJ003_02675 [Candidatus Gastranaerophilales bacterium]|nr:hypothetical protein [Candidatus Gastranaerophilales bacterium]
MKKILLGLLILFSLSLNCFAKDDIYFVSDCQENTTQIQKKCDKCTIEDDEYCIYNQCFFDKHYKRMKKALCLSAKQENNIDKIYKCFKTDMENQHLKYRITKNKLLDMLECENDCYKEQIKALKELKKETKEKLKDYKEDIKEQLCKNQYKDYRKFLRHEKRKMKKIVKYSAVYKFPCTDCCK